MGGAKRRNGRQNGQAPSTAIEARPKARSRQPTERG